MPCPCWISVAAPGATSAFRPRPGGRQHWRLLDHDPALLAQANEDLGRWAIKRGMKASDEGETLVLQDSTNHCRLEWLCLDLNEDWARMAAARARDWSRLPP